MKDMQRRAELSRFLRACRARLTPDQAGLPSNGRRRTPGLRREEVAQLAEVGTSWYTWLEQGRAITASAPVLDSLARALRLDAAERAHLFILARGEVPVPSTPASASVGPAVWQILDALADSAYPAYVANARWDAVAWNAMACCVFVDFAALAPSERNLLHFIFVHPRARELYVDWEGAAQRNLALFRSSSGRYVEEDWFIELVVELSRVSPEFAAWWPRVDVCGTPAGAKELDHPLVGHLALEPTLLQVAQAPDLWMIVYTPGPGKDTLARLQLLMSGAPAATDAQLRATTEPCASRRA
jgi:transcriptional regulator with XRE-family HTH domain